jgi:hypothetical protein
MGGAHKRPNQSPEGDPFVIRRIAPRDLWVSPDRVDPLVKALTLEQRETDVRTYLRLLDERVAEREVHEFLAAHTYFFEGFVRMLGSSPVWSKVKLGSDYEVDFLFFDSASTGPEWDLVEIEAPDKKLFTKSGDQTAHLTHAIGRVRDWQTWVRENRTYAQENMPHIEYPMGLLVMGRRRDLTQEDRRRLTRINHEQRAWLKIVSLDRLAERALQAPLAEDGGHWYLPMRALSHADLSRGLPEHASASPHKFRYRCRWVTS